MVTKKKLRKDNTFTSTFAVHTSCKFRKLKRLAQDDVPMRSEIHQRLGASLAQVFFDYSHREVTKLLNSLSSVKKLPQKRSNCATPDDRSETIWKWSEEREDLKSRIHHDILALGEDVLRKSRAEVEAATQDILRNEFAEKCRELEAEKRLTIRQNAEKIHGRYEEYFESAQRELEEKLHIEWTEANLKRDKELQKAVVKTRMDTTHDVLKRLRPEICHVVTSLRKDFEQSYRAQKEAMIADFNKIIRKEHLKLDARIKEIERRKLEELHIQRHELETQNATDIIYVLCTERLRNNALMHAVHMQFEERIKALDEMIAKQDETINTMKKKIEKYRSKNTMLQEKVDALTKEFQKFINLAFDAVPEHVDFLLPLDLSLVNDTNEENSEREKSDE